MGENFPITNELIHPYTIMDDCLCRVLISKVRWFLILFNLGTR